MKVYISGKISGLPYDEVERNFKEAEIRLQEEGYETVNPLDSGLPVESTWKEHMKADIKMLMDCDTIYLLKNWKDSVGATIEQKIAVMLNYDIIEQIK